MAAVQRSGRSLAINAHLRPATSDPDPLSPKLPRFGISPLEQLPINVWRLARASVFTRLAAHLENLNSLVAATGQGMAAKRHPASYNSDPPRKQLSRDPGYEVVWAGVHTTACILPA